MDDTATAAATTKTESDCNPRRTLTVPEAGRALGIGRSAAYEAAQRGDIPTIRIGRRVLVPVAALSRLLMETEG